MEKIFKNAIENRKFTGVYDVMPEEVYQSKDQIVMIDVRRPDEWTGELGHIEGAQLIVLDELENYMSQLPEDQTIVFICRSGNRSGAATEMALEHGLTEVYNMAGGMILWNEKSYPVAYR